MVYKYVLVQIHSSDLFFWVGFIYCYIFLKKKLYGPFLWMGFNCLKATEPLGRGTFLFTTKLQSILVSQKICCQLFFSSHVLIADFDVMSSAIWYHLYNLKNVKNTHGGVLLLVYLK